MMRAYVQRIESNVKGGIAVELGPRTLVLGPNGSGKSALVNACELAGSGRVSDVAGRDSLAKPEELATLAPPGAPLFSRAQLSDGSWCAFEAHPGKRPRRDGIAVAFPLREVREALTGSPETARKWLLERGAGSGLSWAEVLAAVPEISRARLAQVAGTDGAETPAAARLVSALEGARREARDAQARGKNARVPAPARPPPTDAELAAMAEEVAIGERLPEREAQLTEAHAQVARLEGEARRLEGEIAALPGPRAGEAFALPVLQILEALVGARASECVICGGKADPVTLAARAARGRARMAETQATAKRRDDLAFALREVIGDLSRARRERDRLASEIRGSGVPPGTPLPERGPALPLADARRCLAELHTIRAGWDAHRRGEERAILAEREVKEWTDLAACLSRALGQLAERSRLAFESRVGAFLPEGDRFGLDLEEEGSGGSRAVARVGLRRLLGAEGRPETRPVLHSALSGAEWARVTAAIALATAGAGPSIVVPEERAFDPVTLGAVLVALDRGLSQLADPPQVILTSPTPPAAMPAGWTVIELGPPRESAREAGASPPPGPALTQPSPSPSPSPAKGGKTLAELLGL